MIKVIDYTPIVHKIFSFNNLSEYINKNQLPHVCKTITREWLDQIGWYFFRCDRYCQDKIFMNKIMKHHWRLSRRKKKTKWIKLPINLWFSMNINKAPSQTWKGCRFRSNRPMFLPWLIAHGSVVCFVLVPEIFNVWRLIET